MQGQSYLLAVGIQVDQQLQDQAAGNLQHLEEVAQGRVYPCLPLVVLPSVRLPLVVLLSVRLPLVVLPSVRLPLVVLQSVGLLLACLSGVTVVETSEVAFGVTAGLEVSAAGPLLEEGPFGKAAGLQSLV